MISPGKFTASLNDVRKFLKETSLFKADGPHPVGVYSRNFMDVCRSGRHLDIYQAIRDNLDYEFVLKDDSFFQFCRKDRYLRMSYIENPNITCSREDFLKAVILDMDGTEPIDNATLADLVDDEEYEQYLNELEANANLLYIRYDFDEKGYVPLVHSCSHIHIGMRESIRIPLSKVITPLQFVIFSTKLAYPDVWRRYHESSPDKEAASERLRKIKNQNESLDESVWDGIEESELYLS